MELYAHSISPSPLKRPKDAPGRMYGRIIERNIEKEKEKEVNESKSSGDEKNRLILS